MASCPTWTFQLPGPAADYYPLVRDMALQKGVTLTGDAASGTVAGDTVYKGIPVHLEGHYRAAGSQIQITVTDKPWMAPCGAIYNALLQGITQLPELTPPVENVPELQTLQQSVITVREEDIRITPAPDMSFSVEEVEQWEARQRKKRLLRWSLLGIAVFGVGIVLVRRR